MRHLRQVKLQILQIVVLILLCPGQRMQEHNIKHKGRELYWGKSDLFIVYSELVFRINWLIVRKGWNER